MTSIRRYHGPMPSSRLAAFTLAAGMTIPLGQVQAQPQVPSGDHGWSFHLTPYLWISGIGGTVSTRDPRVPSQTVSSSFGDILSHLNNVPVMGAFEARYGRFGLATDLMAVSVKSNIAPIGALFSGGTVSETQIIGSAVGMYRVVDIPDHRLDLGVGVRAFGIATKFSVYGGTLPGFERSPGVSWATAIAAVRYHMDFTPQWGVSLYGDVGTGGSGTLTWQLFGTIDYNLSNSMSLRIGYRHLQFQHHGPSLNLNMSMSGPILGTTFRF